MKELVILGGGTGGTLMANRMVQALPDGWRVTVVDRDDEHLYQPGLLLLPFGVYGPRDLVKPRASLLDPDVRFIVSDIDRIDAEGKVVALEDGTRLDWDLLVIATGTRTLPEETPGQTGRLWHKTVSDFYTLDGSMAVARALEDFDGGRLVVSVFDMPIKCPVAPLEFAFLADAHLTERGIRDRTELVYTTPLDAAFTKPRAAEALGGMLASRNITLEAEMVPERVDDERSVLVGYDGREVDFDLLVSVPVHGGAEAIMRSDLGDPTGFVPTDPHTLQCSLHPDIFVVGDASDVPTSKAGAVAHFMGETVVGNLLRHIEDRPLDASFDGHANCFIETGFGKAMLIDFNYETEPLPGRFPLPGIGPFTLLEESAVNHWGKLAFKWMYWNLLVRGKDLPFDDRLVMAGKWS